MPDRGPVRWLHRLSIRPPSAEESVRWEIEHHLEELSDRLVQQGWTPDEARREAARRFGISRYGPALRRMERGRVTMEKSGRSVDFLRESVARMLRSVRRDPAFTAAVVITLGLGIGANATMYGVVDRLLLSPPEHVVDPHGLRRVFVERPFLSEIVTSSTITVPDAEDLLAADGFAGVAMYSYRSALTLGAGSDALSLQAVLATHDLFPLLGVAPALGRFYQEAEDRAGATGTAVISSELWRRQFGSDPAILGRTLDLSGRDYTIVGVAPPAFTGVDLEPVDVWLPLRAAGDEGCLNSRGCYWIRAIARLVDGASAEVAEAEATTRHLNGRRANIERGSYSREARVLLRPLIAARGPDAASEARVAGWLSGVSLIVLLIACANVANLLLARGARRRREIAVRLALGVSRPQLVAQMVLETVLLAGLGGALALLLARWGGDFVRSTLLPGVLFPGDAVNGRVIVFTAVATALAGLLAALGPALQATRGDLTRGLAEARPGVSARRSRARTLLMISQAAMSVVLLVGAGLFVLSLSQLRRLDLGLDVDRLVLARLELVDESLGLAETNQLYQEAAERVASLPSVEGAAVTNVPFMYGYAAGLRVPGVDSIPRLPGGGPYYYAVSPDYFSTLGLRITRGRAFGPSDGGAAPAVAVVSETMARTLWPTGEALGSCLLIGDAEVRECTNVVGVVEDAARSGFQDDPYMAYYFPLAQYAARTDADRAASGLYVRTRGRSDPAVGEIATLLRRSLGQRVRYTEVRSLRDILAPQARSWTLGAAMFTVFGLLALAVASIGLYSVLAFDVAQRTRELGIRTALGAAQSRLLRTVLLDGARLVGVGVALGLAVAWLAAPLAQEMLFRVSAREPIVLGGVALGLLIVALAASLGPGLRATRVDPMISLRSD
jgi:predicted permease